MGIALSFLYTPWRALCEELLDYGGEACTDDVLLPWVEANPRSVADLHQIGQAGAMNIPIPNDHDNYTPLQALYALTRVLDLLIAPFQEAPPQRAPVRPDRDEPPGWTGMAPDKRAYGAFCHGVGGVEIAEEAFHPFFHEIVAVQPADDPGHPPELVAQHWPGFLAGSLLLARAGVTVRAGSRWLDPHVASRSPLYWAWWRRGRLAVDESRGWGPNSQWRTDFRRDYYIDGEAYYNVDAAFRAPRHVPAELNVVEQRDLLRYRCGTLTDPGPDLWMWDVSHAEAIRAA
jgi:hypothetical protein